MSVPRPVGSKWQTHCTGLHTRLDTGNPGCKYEVKKKCSLSLSNFAVFDRKTLKINSTLQKPSFSKGGAFYETQSLIAAEWIYGFIRQEMILL